MANTKIKNIGTTEVLEASNGAENVVVELNGGIKRLPVSQIKGSGGGAGFDLMGKKITTVEITSGRSLIECEDSEVDSSLFEDDGPQFVQFFGTGNFNQNNIYKTNCNIIGLGTFVVYGYYYNDAWIVSIPEAGLIEKGFDSLMTVSTGVELISTATFAELKEIAKVRPITASISASLSEMPIPFYFQAQGDIAMYIAEVSDFQKMLPAAIQYKDKIVLQLAALTIKDFATAYLILFEDGTEEEPVLGTIFFTEDEMDQD